MKFFFGGEATSVPLSIFNPATWKQQDTTVEENDTPRMETGGKKKHKKTKKIYNKQKKSKRRKTFMRSK